MFNYWVDGHFISAKSQADAIEECEYLYSYTPDEVRLWTDADDED